jgi:hypothetical protein
MPERLARFRGPVSCARAGQAPELTLRGSTAERPGEPTMLAFSLAAPVDCAETLEGAVVERLGAGEFRITDATREWRIRAAAVHLHREIAVPFYRAIPPRPAPWHKRLFWRVVLVLAASRAGLALLGALRR